MATVIKILELIKDFDIEGGGGGIGRFGIELSRALNHLQFEVQLCGLFDRETLLEKRTIKELNTENITSFYASKWDEAHPYGSFWNSVRFLWNWQSQNNVDIIHSHSEFTDIVALLLKFHPKRPVIMRSVHYGFRYEWRKRPLRRLLLTNLLYPLLFDREIGVSQTITTNLNQRILSKLQKRHAHCIYNAINLKRFQHIQVDRTSKRISLNIPADAPLIGTIGRLAEQKGYTYLIDAAALLLKQVPQAYFLVVGDGELAKTLKDQTNAHGIIDRILFLGQRKDVEEILVCLDLFVSSSLWEGLATAIMESMAARIPVVATDIPGTRELIRNQHTAWLVPPADVPALAATLQTALKDSRSRQSFVNRAFQDVQSFSIDSIAVEYGKVYSNVLQNIHQ